MVGPAYDPQAARAVDSAQMEEALVAEGYEVSAAVRRFLTEFAGLRLCFPHARVPDVQDELHFDPVEAISHIDSEWIAEYRDRVGEPLCVIGEAGRGHLTLSMGPSGRVYAGFDDFLALVGESGLDAIDVLCTDRPLTEIE